MGDVGDLGDRGEGDREGAEPGGERGGPRGEETGEKTESSLGLSILIVGGPPSTDFDRLPPFGEGDRDRRTRRDPKPELWGNYS